MHVQGIEGPATGFDLSMSDRGAGQAPADPLLHWSPSLTTAPSPSLSPSPLLAPQGDAVLPQSRQRLP